MNIYLSISYEDCVPTLPSMPCRRALPLRHTCAMHMCSTCLGGRSIRSVELKCQKCH